MRGKAIFSKKYPNLCNFGDQPTWTFRKACAAKGRQFWRSTGETSEALAYKVGLEMFNQWVGTSLTDLGRDALIRDIARNVLSSKETKRASTYRAAKNQIENHILPAFGHLKPAQLSPMRWNEYDSDERKKGNRTKLFNTRKALLEILSRSKKEGLLINVLRLRNHDAESRQGRYIDDASVEEIIQAASPSTQLLIELVYRMGIRPGEAIQYEWSMIHWTEDEYGRIYIPGRISKTGRSRDIPLNKRVSDLLRERHKLHRSQFLFPSPGHPNRCIKEYKTGWLAACRSAVLVPQRILGRRKMAVAAVDINSTLKGGDLRFFGSDFCVRCIPSFFRRVSPGLRFTQLPFKFGNTIFRSAHMVAQSKSFFLPPPQITN